MIPLECAKRAVEMAIEQDEQTAINWLEMKPKKYSQILGLQSCRQGCNPVGCSEHVVITHF